MLKKRIGADHEHPRWMDPRTGSARQTILLIRGSVKCQPVLQLKFEDLRIEDDLCMNISTLNTGSKRMDPKISNV